MKQRYKGHTGYFSFRRPEGFDDRHHLKFYVYVNEIAITADICHENEIDTEIDFLIAQLEELRIKAKRKYREARKRLEAK